jgi:FkbM family methyltransferase
MPTFNRRRFVPEAIENFRLQTYANRELIIVDDGTDPIQDLVPDDPRIRYVQLEDRLTTGAKRNIACEHAAGELIVHWDDDDWSAPDRVEVQVRMLLESGADLCGQRELLFYEPAANRAWRYSYPERARPWVAGGTMCYPREIWAHHRFPDVRQGEDTQFVWSVRGLRVQVITRDDLYVATIHPGNTSAKRTGGVRWTSVPVATIQSVLGNAADKYLTPGPRPAVRKTKKREAPTMSETATVTTSSTTGVTAGVTATDTARAQGGSALVTVSIPHRGPGTLLRGAVDSILGQIYQDLICVVVFDGDDSDSDKLTDINDPRLVRHVLAENRGRYFADQVVLDASASPYFLVQDSDDWSEPGRVERLLEELERTGADVCLSDVVHHDARPGATHKSRHGWPRLNDPVGPQLVHRAGHQGLYRTEILRAIGGWYAGQRIGFDTSILNFVLMAGGRVVTVPEPLYHRNIRPGSLSTSPETGWNTPERRRVVRELSDLHRQAYVATRRVGPAAAAAVLQRLVTEAREPGSSAALLREAQTLARTLSLLHAPYSGETSRTSEPATGGTSQRLGAIPRKPRPSTTPVPERASEPVSRRSLTAATASRVEPGAGAGRLCIVITTFNRPDHLSRLIDDIEAQWPGGAGLDISVFDDGSPMGYGGIERRLARHGWTYTRSGHNRGKAGWWEWWNAILAQLREGPADRYLVLQDDVRLCDGFFERVERLWSGIDDRRKASLFLHADTYTAEPGRSRWTPFDEVRVRDVVRCGWVDLTAFRCDRRFFDALSWRLTPIERPWDRKPWLGSGVGAQISSRLFASGLGMYRVVDSLVVHAQTPSMLNPEARARWPIRTERFVDGEAAAHRLAAEGPAMFATLASIPSRERQLHDVVGRLLPQVDRLGVYLNGYVGVPPYLLNKKINVMESASSGDWGDAGKFAWSAHGSGYRAICDDDLAYPPDYIAKLVEGIERYGRTAVVGFHGAVLRTPVLDYYRSRRLFHFTQGRNKDVPVHVLGTGVVGYHTSTLEVQPSDFTRANLADLLFARLGQQQRVPFVCLRQNAHWLVELADTRQGSVYMRAIQGQGTLAADATDLARQIPWALHTAGPHLAAAAQPSGRPSETAAAGHEHSTNLGDLIAVPVHGPRRQAHLLLPQADHITLAIQSSGTYYEADLLAAIRKLRRTGTYVDVGAHYGNHALFFALECDAARVVAIEPQKDSLAGLSATMRQNSVGDRVIPLHIAIHPTLKRVELTKLPWQPRRGSEALTNSGMVGIRAAPDHGEIPADTLNHVLEPYDDITLIKVDTEGLSVDVLESGWGVLEHYRPAIAVEAATAAETGRLKDILGPLGYDLVGRFCWTPTWLWVPRGG